PVAASDDPAPPPRRPLRRLRPAVATILVALSLLPLAAALRLPSAWLMAVDLPHAFVHPLPVVNSYRLFAVMATTPPARPVEGSDDGQVWKPYEFRWKPGALSRRPRFVTPHMPRLDWQMWFAALGDWRGAQWTLYFCERLLHGSPPVLALLATNPFPDRPPR